MADPVPPQPATVPIPLKDLVQAFAATLAATSHNLDQASVDLRNLYQSSGNPTLAMMLPPRFTLDEVTIDLCFVVTQATPEVYGDDLPEEDKKVWREPIKVEDPDQLKKKLFEAAQDEALADAKAKSANTGYWHPYLPFLGDEVTGKTIGILGTGSIGQAVIKKCIGFDMNILCYEAMGPNEKLQADVQRQMELRYGSGMQRERTSIKYVALEEVFSKSDFISIHVPLLREGESQTPTYHLINERTLRTMKPTAYLVNTSRGLVIDERALAKALKERWIAGAALDVYETEPLPPDSPLRDPEIEDRCRLYPHFASAGRITRLSLDPNLGMAGRCAQALIDVLEQNYGGDVTKMPYVVNKEAFR